ncbi:YjbH domain-containing protein [Fontimonas sp. SYSU GA230001]|uniref:YjbH domain-containing protein n=1 Tax=Fontimonas sp. SYSU GA230001 TaxID=3142450 RepID=UPI0032B61072
MPVLRRAMVVVLLAAATTGAQAADVRYGPSGYPALLTSPTAAMPPSGTLGVGLSLAPPYNTLYLSAQPASWLHAGARYIEITNRYYDDSRDTGQTFKDKSFDVAVRLIEESDAWPSLVVGLNDFGGTGLFASEYIVVTRRWYDWSFTAGLGFGRFGTYGDVRNPFAALSLRSNERELLAPARARGGVPDWDKWFSGARASLIGGVEWTPRERPWSVQVELDGNDYSADPSTKRLDVRSRINAGLRYHLGGGWYAGLGLIRGDTLVGQIGTAIQAGSARSRIKQQELPAAFHLRPPEYRWNTATVDTPEGMQQWIDDLAARRIVAHAANLDEETGTLTLWQSNGVSDRSLDVLRTAGRASLVHLPDDVERLEVVEVSGGMDALSLTARREDLDAEARGLATTDELRVTTELRSQASVPRATADYPNLLEYPTWLYGYSPAIRANIGGLEGFFVGQLLVKPFMTLQLTPGLSVSAVGALSLYSDLDKLKQRNSSELPHVRSDLESYQSTHDQWWLDRLEVNQLFPLGRDWFGRLSAGIFEEMYGGVAAEVLYRPLTSRLAYGLDVNYVKKRGYDQLFTFLDYQVATGHFTVYYDTPFEGLVVKASAGRYLARDVGVTLDLSRQFRNGVVFGAFATKTNVSAAEFGEGSFDKGIYLSIPLTLFYPSANRGEVNFNYRFLTRDGGQKVRDGRDLWGVVGRYTAGQVYED